ncbi:MAG: TIM44-like domain-containing protein [Thermoleophilaceae bacterium]
MTGRSALLLLGGLVLLAALGVADLALAQAGSGSGGFGGGGGGGGGGGFGGGGGRGTRGGGGIGTLIIIILVAVFVIAGMIAVALRNRKIRKRRGRVHTAAAEAATDNEYLGAEAVERSASELYVASQEAWDARDRAALNELVGEELMVEWNRRLDDFDRKGWHNRVKVALPPSVRYVGLENRADDADDRVVVLIEAQLEAYVEDKQGRRVMRDGENDAAISLEEYWTLARHGDGWRVVSIEQTAEGDHHLDAKIVSLPESDTDRIRDEAVTELAVADAVPEGFATSDLATIGFEGSAREQALDLSVADGRFAPDVLAVAARRAVSAWAEAVDGADSDLQALASPDAVQQLLHGSDSDGRTRLVVRGPSVRKITIVALRVEHEPAEMQVQVQVSATRYVEDRDTTDVLSGSRETPGQFTEDWTMALDGPPEAPWRLVEVHTRVG